jgi:hypothetical protein
VAQRIVNDAYPATASEAACSARAGVRASLPPVAARPRCRRTAAGLHGVAVLAMLAFLAIGQRARALDLTGGPADMPPAVCHVQGLARMTMTTNATRHAH